mgnify:CR=1 FL=1
MWPAGSMKGLPIHEPDPLQEPNPSYSHRAQPEKILPRARGAVLPRFNLGEGRGRYLLRSVQRGNPGTGRGIRLRKDHHRTGCPSPGGAHRRRGLF